MCSPTELLGVLENPMKCFHVFQIELEFGSVGFWGEGNSGVPGEKPLGARERTNNKLNPHMASTPGFEPGPHWWEARVLLPLHLSKTHKRLSLVPVCNCLTTLITVGCLKTDKTRFLLPFTSGPDHEQKAAILLHEHLFILFYFIYLLAT